MNNGQRIEKVLYEIGKLWMKHPKQRFGQLLANYVFQEPKWIFEQPDEETLQKIKKCEG